MRDRGWSLRAVLLAGPIVAVLGVSPALAGRGERGGPIYSSTEAIAYAQAILVKDGYLKPGGYTRGTQDEATLRATRQFQRNHFLLPSGQIDTDTMGVLTTHGPAVEPRSGVAGTRPSGRDGGAGDAGQAGRAKHASRPLPAGQVRDGGVGGPIARTMPVTGSPLAARIALGAFLAASGAALLRRRLF